MSTGHRRNHRARRKRLLKDLCPIVSAPAPTPHRTVDHLKAPTSDNQGFLDAEAFARMREGVALILLSRANVVDFDALMAVVKSGHILRASDVFPQEPLARDHTVRKLPGFIRSAHRAGALDVAFSAWATWCWRTWTYGSGSAPDAVQAGRA